MNHEQIDMAVAKAKEHIAEEQARTGNRFAVVLMISDHPKGSMSLGVDLDEDDGILIGACADGISRALRRIVDEWEGPLPEQD